MLSRLSFFFISFAMFGSVACSTSDDTTSDESNFTAAPGELGGMCGGLAGVLCGSGLTCETEGAHVDAIGRCAPKVTCLALPACDTDDVASDRPCVASSPAGASEGDRCYSRTVCQKTIVCRKPANVEIEGRLTATVGIGGENTGMSIASEQGNTELILGDLSSAFVVGRYAKVIGRATTLSGVETSDRPLLIVKKLVVCPAAGATFHCMPPIAPDNTTCGVDRPFLESKCEGVTYLD